MDPHVIGIACSSSSTYPALVQLLRFWRSNRVSTSFSWVFFKACASEGNSCSILTCHSYHVLSFILKLESPTVKQIWPKYIRPEVSATGRLEIQLFNSFWDPERVYQLTAEWDHGIKKGSWKVVSHNSLDKRSRAKRDYILWYADYFGTAMPYSKVIDACMHSP